MKTKITEFIEANGWSFNGDDSCDEFQSFVKNGCYDIDVGKDEVVLIDESGDFMHIKFNGQAVYTLLGVLIHYSQITMGYNWDTGDKNK